MNPDDDGVMLPLRWRVDIERLSCIIRLGGGQITLDFRLPREERGRKEQQEEGTGDTHGGLPMVGVVLSHVILRTQRLDQHAGPVSCPRAALNPSDPLGEDRHSGESGKPSRGILLLGDAAACPVPVLPPPPFCYHLLREFRSCRADKKTMTRRTESSSFAATSAPSMITPSPTPWSAASS